MKAGIKFISFDFNGLDPIILQEVYELFMYEFNAIPEIFVVPMFFFFQGSVKIIKDSYDFSEDFTESILKKLIFFFFSSFPQIVFVCSFS